MCAADGFRNAVATRAAKHDFRGPLEAHPVALGNEEGLYAVPRPQDGPDHPPVVKKVRATASPVPGLLEGSDKPCFGATDGRNIKQKAHVGRKTETPGVSHSLAVKQNDVGPFPKLLEGPQQGRPLSKREKARDIGKGHPAAVDGFLDDVHRCGIEENNGCMDPAIALAAGDVGPCDDADVRRGTVFQDKPFAQTGLDGRRHPVIDIPGM